MTLHTAIRDRTGVIPIAEWHRIASKVTGIVASKFAYIAAKILDRIIEQLDNIFIAVRERTGILNGALVIVGSFEKASRPIWIGFAISAHEIWISGCIVLNLGASCVLGIFLNLSQQSFLQALNLIEHAFFFIAIPVII